MLIGAAMIVLWRAGLPASPDFFIELEDQPLVPSFTAQTLNGETVTVEPELGHPLIINFWATWCIPCEREMPLLEELYQAGVPILAINAGAEDRETVIQWAANQALTFPIVIDDDQRQLERKFGVRGLPTTFFIDSHGTIQKVQFGELTAPGLQDGLAAIGIK